MQKRIYEIAITEEGRLDLDTETRILKFDSDCEIHSYEVYDSLTGEMIDGKAALSKLCPSKKDRLASLMAERIASVEGKPNVKGVMADLFQALKPERAV